MIRVIHSGDFHLGGSFPEKAAVSAQFLIEQIHDEKSAAYDPDAILFGGDLTDRAIHVHSDRLIPFYNLVKAVTCPIVLLQGTISHEPLGTINNIAELSNRISIIDSPMSFLTIPAGGCIMGLPGLSKPQLAKWMKDIGSEIDGFADPTAAIKEALAYIATRWSREPGPKILLGHWSVSGCVTPTGQTMIGSDLEVGLDDLALTGASAVMLNHIHKPQEWRDPIFASYSGPPYPTSWGELHQCSFSVFEFDDETGKMTSFERIPFPHLPMLKLDIEFTGKQTDGEWDWEYKTPLDESMYHLGDTPHELKICYSLPKEIAHQVDDMHIWVMFKKMNIEIASIDRIIQATSRERIADLASMETTRSQYEAICEAKGETPREGALVKADAIDEKVVAL